jgi:GNAT superfamily N-acetyltransferase
MSSKVEIRAAQPRDIPALVQLLQVLFSQEVEFKPDGTKQEAALLMILSDSAHGTILVAENSEQILGMVSLLPLVSTALGTRVAILEDMVVAPSARGIGVGAKLLGSAIVYAKSEGYARLTLLTDQDNLTAQQFYENAGFIKSTMVPMRLTIKL